MMKALSVVEHAGRLITSGQKTLEIRRWKPDSLPLIDLAIVQNQRRLTLDQPVDPEGRIVAVVDVRMIREWTEADAEAACSAWEAGWLAWELENIRVVVEGPPVPAMRRICCIETLFNKLKLRS